MKYLVQPMFVPGDNGRYGPDCPTQGCYYDPCPKDWCDNYCGDFDPCAGYSCGAYSTRSIGE